MILDSTLQEILNRADIVEIIGSTMDLKASGPNNKGCCPFHEEKSASFNVNSVRQKYHCFGCGETGDIFDFFIKTEGLTFPEAVRKVGEMVGVKVEDRDLTPEERKLALEKDRVIEINALAFEFYRNNLIAENIPGSPVERELQRLGLDEAAVQEFGFGYAPDQWDSLMKYLGSRGVSTAEMVATGLLQQKKSKKGYYDMLRNRLPFPITDQDDNIVAFMGKALDEKVKLKFLTTGDSAAFDREKHLLGLSQSKQAIRKRGSVILVQRIVDLFVLRQAGFDNVVVTCGGPLNGCHADQLKKLTSRVYLLFPQNSRSTLQAFTDMAPLLERGLSVVGVMLGESEAPSKFLRNQGVDAFKELMVQAKPILEIYINTSIEGIDPSDKRPTEEVKEMIGKIRLLPSILERALYAKEIASRTPFREKDLIDAALEGSI